MNYKLGDLINYKCNINIIYLWLMDLNEFRSRYSQVAAKGRYLPYALMSDVMAQFSELSVHDEGLSVNGQVIRSYTLGSGPVNILMWSQMHGNETTSSKALLDLILFVTNVKDSLILDQLKIVIIPMLNPDGADDYTRANANGVDLNRDALDQTQPESQLLLKVFERMRPEYCFNLHDQRPIFGAGSNGQPTALSFLAPSGDVDKSWNKNRTEARAILGSVAKSLSSGFSEKLARFDDAFNLNCFGDFFQSRGAATMLFEAGQDSSDYSRDQIRLQYCYALYVALERISCSSPHEDDANFYSKMPKNVECFCDILVKNAVTTSGQRVSLGLTYQEQLIDHKIVLKPFISHISPSSALFGHRVIFEPIYWKDTFPLLKVGSHVEYLEVNSNKLLLNLTIF